MYDANGNLSQDKHTCPVPKVGKELTIAYNHLNLPHAINNLADEYILLTYTADGEKLTKLAGGVTKNYVAGIEYAGANLEAVYPRGLGTGTPKAAARPTGVIFTTNTH